MEGADFSQVLLEFLKQRRVLWIANDVVNLLGIVKLVVKLRLTIAPLDVPPAFGADGLAISASTARDEGESGVATFCVRIVQQRAKALAGKRVRGFHAAVVGHGGVQIDQLDQ